MLQRLWHVSEDLFAQALEMELEIDRRLCLHKHLPKHLEIQHGVFAWSATRIFLVDALNEAERDRSNKSFYDLLERDSLQVYIRNFDSFFPSIQTTMANYCAQPWSCKSH